MGKGMKIEIPTVSCHIVNSLAVQLLSMGIINNKVGKEG